jgi:MoxR-like ATPase|tara:strand:+ start:347 stop:1591 length:1245 start_codon:yes stop_codon:yes gene_type:complete
MKGRENTMLNQKQIDFVKHAKKLFPNKVELTLADLVLANKEFGHKYEPQWLTKDKNLKVDRGLFKLPNIDDTVEETKVSKTETVKENKVTEAAYIVSSLTGDIVPKKDSVFVSFGNYPDLKSIVKTKMFYPVFITGLSGNGKTMGVTQACAENRREMIRVNVTIETDEDDLLGGYRLKDGQTVWQNGPVIEAMERGAILLLDEIDLASNKIMCLQPILEGSGIFVKKINKFVKPADGFNVIATANTKGQGSEDGKFIGTNVLNEAFLERFPITFEQKYPSVKIEEKILIKTLERSGKKDQSFCKKLVTWADVIRKTFFDGGVDEIISTRRLVHIVQAFTIFKDKIKAIEVCTNRFDEDTKNSFVELYTKVDGGATADTIAEDQRKSEVAQQVEDNESESKDDAAESDNDTSAHI